jgi:hypothetical protein
MVCSMVKGNPASWAAADVVAAPVEAAGEPQAAVARSTSPAAAAVSCFETRIFTEMPS